MSNNKDSQLLVVNRKIKAVINTGTILLAAAILLCTVSYAADQIMAVGIDRKFEYSDEGKRSALAPGRDEVLSSLKGLLFQVRIIIKSGQL